jgi:hypothetical protein
MSRWDWVKYYDCGFDQYHSSKVETKIGGITLSLLQKGLPVTGLFSLSVTGKLPVTGILSLVTIY